MEIPKKKKIHITCFLSFFHIFPHGVIQIGAKCKDCTHPHFQWLESKQYEQFKLSTERKRLTKNRFLKMKQKKKDDDKKQQNKDNNKK